jgi:uncharacterized RDD family membrane protein YckC
MSSDPSSVADLNRCGALRRLAVFGIDLVLIALLLFAVAAGADRLGSKRFIPWSPFSISTVTTLHEEQRVLPDGTTERDIFHLEAVDSFGLWQHHYLIEVSERIQGDNVDRRRTRVLVDPETLQPIVAITSNGLTFILLPWLILFFEFSGIRSPARALLGLRVVGADGAAPGPAQVLRRGLVKAFPFFLIALSEWRPEDWVYWIGAVGGALAAASFFLALVSRRKTALHDLVGGTSVVRSA